MGNPPLPATTAVGLPACRRTFRPPHVSTNHRTPISSHRTTALALGFLHPSWSSRLLVRDLEFQFASAGLLVGVPVRVFVQSFDNWSSLLAFRVFYSSGLRLFARPNSPKSPNGSLILINELECY